MIARYALPLLLSSLPLAAQTPDPCATAPQTCATLINTQATAQTRVPNSAVDISVGITASGKDLSEVQRSLAERSSSLLTYLRSQQAQRLITTSVSFAPETRYQKNALDKTVGYTGSSHVTFRTTPEKAPVILAGVLDHGASNIDSNTFTPTEEEIAAARSSLSAEATRTAIAQAEAIAKAANMHLAGVRSINVQDNGNFSPRPVVFAKMQMDSMAAGAPPIETAAGDQSLSVRVDVTIAAMR